MIGTADSSPASADLAKRLRTEGFALALAYVRQAARSDAATAEGTSGDTDERKRHMQRERQRKKTDRDAPNWRRCYARAPNDPDARDLVAEVARVIADPRAREAVRIAVENPQAAFLGRRILAIAALLRLPVRGR